MRPEENASDLAVEAVHNLAEYRPDEVDLLLFASASQDMVEPATSHIVAAKLGLRVPVFDVKNACNSIINALEVANALIRQGSYRTILIASGEGPSRAVRTDPPDRQAYLRAAAGYTMSDAGAALLVSRSDEVDDPGRILASEFVADSTRWDVGMLPGGGTAFPRDESRSYFEINGARLREIFLALGPEPVHAALAKAGVGWEDVALVAVHQVARTYLDDVLRVLDVPVERTIVTITEHGNVASVTLPLQLVQAVQSGRLNRGDVVVLIGLAGGVSLGVMVLRW